MTTRRVQGYGGGSQWKRHVDDVGSVLQTVSVDLAANVSAVAAFPVYATLMSGTITITLGTRLAVRWSGNPFHSGASLANGAMTVRLRLDGTLLSPGAGTTENAVRLMVQSLVYEKRVPITPGLHAVDVEWSLSGAAGNVLNMFPVAIPDFVHANLTLQEQDS